MTKHPDLLDEAGVRTIINYLDKQKDQEVQRLLLKWTKECCIMHETNRFDFVIFCFCCLIEFNVYFLDNKYLMLRFWTI